MTVAETVSLLRDASKVELAWNGSVRDLDINDPIALDAFGDYIVSGIYATDEDSFEIVIAVQPVRRSA